MPELDLYLFLALAAVALLLGLRYFVLRPRRSDHRSALLDEPRAALRQLWSEPDPAAGREAEAQGDWSAARAAYGRALEALRLEDASDPAVALKRRALESKLEELQRVQPEPD